MTASRDRASLVVLGMHRSGTSALAGSLGLCGAWLGEEAELTAPNKENPRGFFERRDLRAICDRLLHAAGADWWKVSGFEPISIPHDALAEQSRALRKTLEELDKHGTWVIKEPRLCLLLPALRGQITAPVCIHVHRNPLEVAHSLRLRNGFGIAEGIALWEAYNLRALHASEGLRRVLVSYEELMTDPGGCIARLVEELGRLGVPGLEVPAPDEIADFITPGLQRQRFGQAETEAFLTPSQLALWQDLQSGQAFHKQGVEGLDKVPRQHLADLESRKYSQDQAARKVSRLDEQIRKQKDELEARDGKLEQLRLELSTLVKQVPGMKSRVEELEGQLAQRDGQLEARVADLDAARNELGELMQRIDGLEAALASANGNVLALKAQIAELEDGVAQRDGQLGQHIAELASANEGLLGLEARIEGQQEALARSADELRAAEGRLSGERARADQLRADIGKRDRKLVASSKKLDSAAAQLSELKLALKERNLEKKVLSQHNATLEAQLKEMYASHSWRVTAPLRSMSLALKWLARNVRRCFILLGWLATGQFSRARTASRPYLEVILPRFAHGLLLKAGPEARRSHSSGSRSAGKAPGPAGKSSRKATSKTRAAEATEDILTPGLRKTVFGKNLGEILAADRSTKFQDALLDSERRLEAIGKRASGADVQPLVSIIMPTHDRASIIAAAIASVREQGYRNWELLVCDDASSDNTEDVVAGFNDRRIRYLKLERGGAAAARNAGLREARGAVIAYLDSDNYWHPGYLAAMVQVLEENPGRSAAYASYIDFQVDAGGKRKVRGVHFSGFHHERLLDKNYIDLNTFIHRRELYDHFGGFNDKLTRRQDYDLILKYTWLRDPVHVPCLLALYQRNDSLVQITKALKHDKSCEAIIDGAVEGYLEKGLPVASALPIRKVTILSWDLCRNHFSKAFALAEALSKTYEVQLVSFRFFEEEIFPPLQGVKPSFETLYLPGGKFPEFFESVRQAVDAINGEVIYVVKPRMPSLGVALLANQRRGIPLALEINDLETVVSSPTSEDRHIEEMFETVDLANPELLNPYSDLWSQLMDPIAKQLPVLVTHNRNIDSHFGHRCLYMRNLKDEHVYDPGAYDRAEIRSQLGFAPEDRVILFGGLLRKHKGIYELVDLVERLGDPRYKLLFVGSRVTPDQKKLMDRFGDRVRVLPPQDRESMARINLAADLVILWLDPDVPASAYQMPYKATDALAMRTSIIANGISDLGDLGRQGYLRIVSFGDWERMVTVIEDVFKNSQKRERREAAGRRLYLRQFSYAAARGNFQLIGARSLDTAGHVLPAAKAFAERFEEFQKTVSGSRESQVPAIIGQADQLPLLDAAKVAEDDLIEVWQMKDLSRLAYRDPHGAAVILPTSRPGEALSTARRLVKRAGIRTRVFVIDGVPDGEEALATMAASQRLDVKYLVYLSDTAYPGLTWLKRAFNFLDGKGKGLLLFNTAGEPGQPGMFGMVRKQWLRGLRENPMSSGSGWGGPWLQLVEAARRADESVYDADCVMIDISSTPWAEGAARVDPGTTPDDHSIQVLDVQEIAKLEWSDPEGVAVIMPCINPERGMATARFLRSRAGIDHRIYVVVDTLRQGFIKTLNRMASALDVKYIVYLAEDAFPGPDWLRIAHDRLEKTGRGLLAFNCGKWRGRVAAFGMVRVAWARELYGGPILFDGYKAHKADNELTVIARVNDQFDYVPESTLVEYDLGKVFTDTVRLDPELFDERFRTGFGGLASVQALRPLAKEYFVSFDRPRLPKPSTGPISPVALPGEDTFVFYRIIGNDLYPRHRKGQALDNLKFILAHEPELPGCEKRFVLNRILDEDQERQIMALLDEHGHVYTRIPFDREEYRKIGFDTEVLPRRGFLSNTKYESLKDVQKDRATLAIYRHKNNYVMNNNGARNFALADGRGRAKWILPWDGNCFLTREAWEQIRRDVGRKPEKKYFVVPMARMLSNEPLINGGEIPKAVEEPQIIFRTDATERFNPEFCYGRRPKVELLWRLGVEGPWDNYRDDAWDQKRSPVSAAADHVGSAGWVARLFSGMASLEGNTHHSMLNRGFARSEAIVATLRHLDVQLAGADADSPVSVRSRVLLEEIQGRDAPGLREVVEQLRRAADEALERGPFSVIDKTTLPPSGDRQDYWHPAPYWWPNPRTEDGLPYIRKDGVRVPGTRMYEPDSEKYDRTRLQRVFDDSLALALAWSFTQDDRYANHGAKILERFFVDPETRMNPHLKYGQVRTGHNNNQGAPTGLIEMKDMYYYLDAARILESAGTLDEGTLSGFRGWLEQYLEWLLTSKQGRGERSAVNNHGTCYDLQVAAIASYLGNEELVYTTLMRAQARIGQQFTSDGKQPDELKRTTTAHYCSFNFQGWINLAELASRWGVDLWSHEADNGASLAQGARWLLSHMGKRWPYEQIDEFDAARFQPIWFAANEHVDHLPPNPEGASLYSVKPVFFPHDGIRPFWNLGSYRPRAPVDRQPRVRRAQAAAPVSS